MRKIDLLGYAVIAIVVICVIMTFIKLGVLVGILLSIVIGLLFLGAYLFSKFKIKM